ncbi:MAG: protein-L-isoaspartate(D-aspartate) O-methyltransferase [Methanomicrobiales archaeon]|jgi:protein-L-isoaspartate(D-aspartate) O-methyltransferase|nr:protein-L-isoaspartate(D-aspartate) O-methyltransferase [Methanomicrobiales archaeon]
MVEYQIAARGVRDPRVLSAMREVPRHLFVPDAQRSAAYDDRPLPIGSGQTISQPYIVALMTELLEPMSGDTVLEIGAGSGYQAAILAKLVSRVVTIERLPEIATSARERLHRLGITSVAVEVGDGTMGFPPEAPYQGILVTAATPEIPAPLLDQLAEGGRLVAPAGGRDVQELIRVRKQGGELIREYHGAVCFVPLIGEFGWKGRW